MGYINPLLKLTAARDLLDLPIESRRAIVSVLRELRSQANDEAEVAWARPKGPMAAYWRAVATYARHLAHAVGHERSRPPSVATTSPNSTGDFTIAGLADASEGLGTARTCRLERGTDGDPT